MPPPPTDPAFLADSILRQQLQLQQQQHPQQQQQQQHPSPQRSRIQCPVCRNLVVRRVFRRHFETLHCVQAPVPCRFCSKVFKHRYSLDCHLRQAHPLQRFQDRGNRSKSSSSSSTTAVVTAAATAALNNNDSAAGEKERKKEEEGEISSAQSK